MYYINHNQPNPMVNQKNVKLMKLQLRLLKNKYKEKEDKI